MRVVSLVGCVAMFAAATTLDSQHNEQFVHSLRRLQENTTAPVTPAPTTSPPTTSKPTTTVATPSPPTTAPVTTAPTTTATTATTTAPATTQKPNSTPVPSSESPQTPPPTSNGNPTPPATPAPTSAGNTPRPSSSSLTAEPEITDPADTSTSPSSTSKLPTTTSPNNSEESSNTGTYIGIGVGAIAGIGLIGAGVYFLLKRSQDDDDDPMSPDFKDVGNSSLYGAPPPPSTLESNPPPKAYEPAPHNHVIHQSNKQSMNPSPVPILAAPTVEYHNIHTNSTMMNTFRSAQEDNDYDRPSMSSNNDSVGGNAWTHAMNQKEVSIDDFESSSYNSINKSAFNDDFDSQSEASRGSSFMTRNSFQSHMSSELDHNDFPMHKESNAERGSYEL